MPACSMRPVQAPLLVKQCSIFARRVSTVGPLQHINLVQLLLASTAGRCHAVPAYLDGQVQHRGLMAVHKVAQLLTPVQRGGRPYSLALFDTNAPVCKCLLVVAARAGWELLQHPQGSSP